MDHFNKYRKYFLQMSCNSNNNGIKIMLCSPDRFMVSKIIFISKPMIRAPLMSKVGEPVKIFGKNVA